jgi:hypothetical protein
LPVCLQESIRQPPRHFRVGDCTVGQHRFHQRLAATG